MMKLTGLAWVLRVFLAPGVDALQFEAPPHRHMHAARGLKSHVSCTTDDPQATVKLLHAATSGTRFREKLVTPNKLSTINQIFTVISIGICDGGVYRCWASDGNNTIGNNNIEWPQNYGYVIIPNFVPPIRVEPSVAEILLGEDIDLTCYSDGLETVLRWDKRVDGVYTRVADSMVTYTKHSNLNQVKSVLSIRDAQYLDSAAYRCTLVSVNGQRRTAHGNAIVKASMPPMISDMQDMERRADEKKWIELKCDVSGYPKPTVTWYNSKGRIDLPGSPVNGLEDCKNRRSGFYKLSGTDNLVICLPSHEPYTGTYKCEARNKLSATSKSLYLNVLEISRIPNEANQWGQLYVKIKGKVNETCIATGNPVPTVEWRKSDGTLVSKGRGRAQLLIKSMEDEDFGKYICVAKNSLGLQKKTLELVRAFIPPMISDMQDMERRADEKKWIKLICNVGDLNPELAVTWYNSKGIIDLPQSPVSGLEDCKNKQSGFYELSGTNNLVICLPSHKPYTGTYKCEARYRMVVTSKSVHLNVLLLIEEPTAGPRSDFLMIGLVSGFGAFLVIAILVIVLICRFQKKQTAKYRKIYFGQGSDYQFNPKRTLLEQSSDLPYDPDWEFPEERLLLGDLLDSGNFGLVYIAQAIGIVTFDARNKSLAAFKRRSTLRKRVKSSTKIEKNEKGQQYDRTTVAVKTLKADATTSDYKDLVSELKIMIHVGQHKNIINLLGACTRGKRLMLIIEFAPHGSLIKFLRKKREIFQPTWLKETTSPETEFTIADLAMEAYQVARGLEYLASNKCVHRDVAARNVLVADGYVLKLSDFGLARDVHQDDKYVKTTTGALPVKWMALESIISRVYSEKSDVWSFGVLLWELFTLGGVPYNKMPTAILIAAIAGGHRLECPLDCPVEMYTLMRDCWLEAPDRRPTFTHIVDRLGHILEKSAAQASAEYISFLNDGLPNDYYLRPVDSSGPLVTNGAAPPLSPRDEAMDFAHEPLPPIPGSESADHNREPDERDRAPDERDRATDDKGTARFSSVSVENESGIGLDDSAGESDKLVPGSDEQRAKVNRKNNVVVGQPISPSKNGLEPRYSHGSHERMETAV